MIISRFILDLRGVYYPTERTQVSTINFATGTIAGNFGAPLRTDSTWISGRMDDDDDVEEDGDFMVDEAEDGDNDVEEDEEEGDSEAEQIGDLDLNDEE